MKYKESVEKLLETAKVNEEVGRRVKGTFVDILAVKKGYELAMERTIGANAQCIVTEDIDDAIWLIEYLKRNISGTITFFPAKNMAPILPLDSVLQGNGVLGFASDFIQYEELYEKIVLNVLKDAVICDTLENAVEFVKKEGHKYRVITLAGDVIERNGRIIGVGKNYERKYF